MQQIKYFHCFIGEDTIQLACCVHVDMYLVVGYLEFSQLTGGREMRVFQRQSSSSRYLSILYLSISRSISLALATALEITFRLKQLKQVHGCRVVVLLLLNFVLNCTKSSLQIELREESCMLCVVVYSMGAGRSFESELPLIKCIGVTWRILFFFSK